MIPLRLALVLRCLLPGAASAAAPGRTILVIADGLGIGGLSHALDRYGESGSPALPNIAAFTRRARSSLVSTRSADSSMTDSAAAATAIACGVKTGNGALGMDLGGKPVTCLGELVKSSGKALGLITTTDVWDATPAAFGAHVMDRRNRKEIERQQKKLNPDVLLGDDRRGPFNGDKSLELPRAARHALDIVSGDPDGFFLLVETERTDETGHQNDLPGFLSALEELDRTIAVLLEYQAAHPEATLVLTSDHDTGGLGVYPPGPAPSWLTKKHTGAPVPLFAVGPTAATLPGMMDNTEVFGFLVRTLGLWVPDR